MCVCVYASNIIELGAMGKAEKEVVVLASK